MTKTPRAVIFGCAGTSLTKAERAFFRKVNPLGLILFDRNVQNPEQVKALIADFRGLVGRDDAPVLVDQEGGRVQRLWPPYWTGLPFCRTYGDWYGADPEKAVAAVKKHARTLAKELLAIGINIDCWPCLDVAGEGLHDILAKRCFSDSPEVVAHLGQVAVDTALSRGLMPVIKHIPGYGRTQVDPHRDLPTVTAPLDALKQVDFYPFTQIHQPVWGMTAHVVYTALDKKVPATLSKKVLDYVRNQIGFNGFLICDDMVMGALSRFGTLPELAQKMLAAGCDAVLHGSGDLAEMQAIAAVVPTLSKAAQTRLQTAKESCQ